MIEPSILRARATGSGAERWMNCPASVAMSQGIVEKEKLYASAGTRAHEEAAGAMKDAILLEDIEDDAVRTYVGYIRDVVEYRDVDYVCENRLPLLGSSGGIDCYVVLDKTVHLFDFKYGVGVKLYAQENAQLAFYACALKEKFPETTTVIAHLIQPRVEGDFEDTPSISTWILPWQTIAAWKRKFEKALNDVEKATRIRAGNWCQFCLARGGCPVHIAYVDYVENQQKLESLIPGGTEVAVTEDTLPTTDIPKIARLLLAKKRVHAWFSKAEELLLFHAERGVPIPGFELARKRTNRRWLQVLQEDEIAEKLRERGIGDPYEHKLLAITKVEKRADIDDLVEKPEGNFRLKPVDKQYDDD